MDRKFFIYTEIFEIENLANEIAKDTKFLEEWIKENVLLKSFMDGLDKIERNFNVRGLKDKNKALFIIDNLEDVFGIINEILNIKLPIQNPNYKLSYKIAIESRDIEKEKVEEGEIFKILKDIADLYEKYKRERNEKIETFICITDEFSMQLDYYDNQKCKEIHYDGKKFKILPIEIIKNNLKISEFLKKIGKSWNEYLCFIDKIFVPPDNYNEIKEKLEKERIVIIYGEKGYGKTYTSIRLLWEYYNKGYVPKFHLIETNNNDLIEKIINVKEIKKSFSPGHISLFEANLYNMEEEQKELLNKNINFFHNLLKDINDIFVIISLDVSLENFNKEEFSGIPTIQITYNDEKKKEIFEKWALMKNWKFENEEIKNFIFENIKNLTPLGIHDFIDATKNLKSKEELKEKIQIYSDPSKAFANEIINKCKLGFTDEIVFLSYIFVSQSFRIHFVKRMCKKFNLNFENIIKNENKITSEIFLGKNILKFSHPSYYDSINYLIDNENFMKIFCNVLKQLAKTGYAAYAVIKIVKEKFDKIPEDVIKEMLLELSKNEDLIYDIVDIIIENFEILGKYAELKNLLLEYSKNKYAGYVGKIIVKNFEKMPIEIKEILFKISENEYIAGDIATEIAARFESLPEDVRNLLFKFSENENTASGVIIGILNNYQSIRENVRNLLFKFSENEKYMKYVAYGIFKNYDSLPDNVRNLLYKIMPYIFDSKENDKSLNPLIIALMENFDKLPDDLKTNILLKLSENPSLIEYALYIANMYLDGIPKDITLKLFEKFFESKIIAGNAAQIIAKNYKYLPDDVRNLLIKEFENYPNDIAVAIIDNYNNLPENVRNLLFKFSNENTRENTGDIAAAIIDNYLSLPENVRNLLFKFSNENNAKKIARAIMDNFNDIPENIRNLLFKYNNEDVYNEIVYGAIRNFDILPKNISKLAFNMYSIESAEAMIVYSLTNFEEIPEEFEKFLFNLSENENTAHIVVYVIVFNYREILDYVKYEILKRVPKQKLESTIEKLSNIESYESIQDYYETSIVILEILKKLTPLKISARFVDEIHRRIMRNINKFGKKMEK